MADIKHLHGSLYLVPFSSIKLPDSEEGETKDYKFQNPRTLTENGNNKLYDKDKSLELRESIRKNSLMSPFICRWVGSGDDKEPQLIAGDRRYRAVDFMITKKELVKDHSSGKINSQGSYEFEDKPANEVFEFVPCQIYYANDDLEALSYAYDENNCRENLTPGHDIALVRQLRTAGANDSKILDILCKDSKWLRDTDNLLSSLDEGTINDLIEDRVVRDAAMGLLEISDVETRQKVLAVAKQEAEENYKKRITRIQKAVSNAKIDEEIAEGELVEAKFNQDPEMLELAEKKIEQAQQRIAEGEEATVKSKPTVKKKQIRSGIKATGVDIDTSTCLSKVKIEKHYIEPLEALLKNRGVAEDATFMVEPDALELAIKIVKGILRGDIDSLNVVKRHVNQ